MSIVRPVEPAHDGRTHPREGPGQGPEKWPIRERLCHGEVRKARWEDSAVPGKLDRDIHDEILKKMQRWVSTRSGLVSNWYQSGLPQLIYTPFAPMLPDCYCSLHGNSANRLIFLEQWCQLFIPPLATLFLLCVRSICLSLLCSFTLKTVYPFSLAQSTADITTLVPQEMPLSGSLCVSVCECLCVCWKEYLPEH